MDIALQRLAHQRLIGKPFAKAEEVVDWLVAVQAQDYAGAKWGIGQRTRSATNKDLDKAFNSGALIRTHVLRPTWHFVRPADLRWLLMLTAPRVEALNAYYYRQQGLDPAKLVRCIDLMAKALSGGKHLMRSELGEALSAEGVGTSGLALTCAVIHAELEGVICSGPMRGKQFTYALIDEWVPPAPERTRDEALAELARRFAQSRGPVTAQDFATWSGLTVADAKLGFEMNNGVLEERGGFWFGEPLAVPKLKAPALQLLPNYDEYVSSYKDASLLFDPPVWETVRHDMTGLYAHFISRNGKIVGGWKRTLSKKEAVMELNFFTELADAETEALGEAVAAYGRFMDVTVR